MNIHIRIKTRRLELKMSPSALADAIGVSRSAILLWEKEVGGTVPAHKHQEKVAECLKVSLAWLLTGNSDNVQTTGKYVFIPLYTYTVKGGKVVKHHDEVADLNDENNTYAYRIDYLQKKGVLSSNCRVFLNDDGSTTGSQFLVDTTDCTLRQGEMYAVAVDAKIMVRRLVPRFDGVTVAAVTLQSESANFPDQDVPPKAVSILGRVVGFTA